jgi:hypothetical protein
MEAKVREGIVQIVRKGETIFIIDSNENMFSTADMFLMHITKERMDKYIKQVKEGKQ